MRLWGDGHKCMINAWHCQNIYSGGKNSIITGQDCTVSSSTPTSLLGTYDKPIISRDDGSIIFGLGVIIFFSAILFFGLLFNSFNLKK